MLRYALFMVGLFFVGVLISVTANYLMSSSEPTPSEDDSIAVGSNLNETGSNGTQSPSTNSEDLLPRPAEPLDVETSDAIVDLIRAGDKFLLAGNARAAFSKYRKARSLDGSESAALANKLALCAELNAEYAQAEFTYTQVMDSRTDLNQQYVAQIGLIRTWQRLGKGQDSFRRLADLFLNFQSLESQHELLQAELLHELAGAFQEQALQSYHHDFSQIDGVAFSKVPVNVDSILHLINTGQSVSGIQDVQESIEVVQQPSPVASLTVVSAHSKAINLTAFIEQLVRKSELVTRLSPMAMKRMKAYSQRVQFQNYSLAMVLDALLQPIGLRWEQRANEIYVFSPEEIEPAGSDSEPPSSEIGLYQSADRFLRHFTIKFPNDYRASAATLSRANLKMLAAEYELAANLFELVRQSNAVGELRAMLAFNRGKLHLVTGRHDMALEDFFLAADQSYDPVIQSTAYWLIGKNYLERDQFDESIRSFGRALALARNDQQRRLAALELAIAYLLSDQPAAANQTVFQNRHAFEPNQKRLALIVSSYAHFVGVEDAHSRSVAEKRLLESLALSGQTDSDWYIEYYIAGRAYQDLGIPDLAMEMFERGINVVSSGEWKSRLRFALASEKLKSRQHLDASRLLGELFETGSDNWKVLAAVQLASLYSSNAMHEDCISIGEQVLATDIEMEPNQREQLLKTMGRSFRALGQHHSSALCFAGLFSPIPPTKVN